MGPQAERPRFPGPCRPLLLLPPIPPSIRVFSNESTLRMRWPKYWSFSFSTSVMSDSLRPHGLQPARLLCPWDSPDKNSEVGVSFPAWPGEQSRVLSPNGRGGWISPNSTGGLTPFSTHIGLQEIPIAIRDESGILCREPLVRRQGSQVSMRVSRGNASLLSSHGRGIGIQDA